MEENYEEINVTCEKEINQQTVLFTEVTIEVFDSNFSHPGHSHFDVNAPGTLPSNVTIKIRDYLLEHRTSQIVDRVS